METISACVIVMVASSRTMMRGRAWAVKRDSTAPVAAGDEFFEGAAPLRIVRAVERKDEAMRDRRGVQAVRRAIPVLAIGIAMSAGCGDLQEPSEAGEIRQSALSASDLELARHWAPVHFQDVNKSGATGMQGRADY